MDTKEEIVVKLATELAKKTKYKPMLYVCLVCGAKVKKDYILFPNMKGFTSGPPVRKYCSKACRKQRKKGRGGDA